MGTTHRPRHGSLQFWPRKRVDKALPSVNWSQINTQSEGLLGFIGYKVGMASAFVKDNTKDSLTKSKKIVIPVTILEVPGMKIYSIRFYKNNQVMKEVVVSNDKELKRVLKTPKTLGTLDNISGYDDIRVIVYSLPKKIGFKKAPDMIELAINAKDKLAFATNLVGKELTLAEMTKTSLLDVRGLTTGKGLVGPVKRYGITLKQHKSEKGRRRPGSLGPWHPSRVTFRTPMSGQMGMFTRVHYNLKVVTQGNAKDKPIKSASGFSRYGQVKNEYVVLAGSVQGPAKRQILFTPSFRPTKKQAKKEYEFLELST